MPHNLPRSGAVAFVGRDEDLENLHTQMQTANAVAISAIAGMGGIGKTELALQYARTYLAAGAYPGGVCWLQVRDQEVGSQLVSYGQVQLGLTPPDGLELTDQVAYIWRNWPQAKGEQPWPVLVVYDDVTDYGQLRPYLPPNDGRFAVLMTTRLRLGRSIKHYEIKVLSETAALQLLGALAGEDRVEAERETAEALCKRLGYLPLGIELVGRYLARKPALSFSTLQTRLEAKRLAARALLKQDTDQDLQDMTAELGVAAAFELSWQTLSAEAQRLACSLSLFALAPFSWVLVEPSFAGVDAEDLEEWRDELLSLHLVERNEARTYQLHQLIREFLAVKRQESADDLALQQGYCQAMVAIARKVPPGPTRDHIIELTPAIPHLAEAATHWHPVLSDEDVLWPFNALARFYAGQGSYGQAEPWYTQCLSLSQGRFGEAHPAVATSLNNLAELYRAQGRYREAEPLHQQALALRQKLLGEDHYAVAQSYNNLALLYKFQGRYREAEPLYHQALALYQKLLGEAHPYVAQSYNNLALLYSSQGRYREAEPLHQQALALNQKLLGEAHPDVAMSLNNLAFLYESQGRYREAEPLHHQALALNQKLLGEAHPDVATSLNNLASLYSSQGRYREAESLYQQALTLYQKLLGEAHPHVAMSLNNLAELYRSQGRYSEAEPLYHQALALYQKLLGEAHPHVAMSLYNLANLYYSQDRYSEAEPLYQQALALQQKLFGEAHPDVATSLNNLALLYKSQGLLIQRSGTAVSTSPGVATKITR